MCTQTLSYYGDTSEEMCFEDLMDMNPIPGTHPDYPVFGRPNDNNPISWLNYILSDPSDDNVFQVPHIHHLSACGFRQITTANKNLWKKEKIDTLQDYPLDFFYGLFSRQGDNLAGLFLVNDRLDKFNDFFGDGLIRLKVKLHSRDGDKKVIKVRAPHAAKMRLNDTITMNFASELKGHGLRVFNKLKTHPHFDDMTLVVLSSTMPSSLMQDFDFKKIRLQISGMVNDQKRMAMCAKLRGFDSDHE
jgi:hypothetical protein